MHAAVILLVSIVELLSHLSGTWKAPDERVPRNTPLDVQVFGAGAMDVRTVTLVITPSGDATLEVRRSVVGKTGKVFAPSVMDVKMHIGEPVTMELGHLRPKVDVTSAAPRNTTSRSAAIARRKSATTSSTLACRRIGWS